MVTDQNISILDLRDIVVPEDLALWPPAPFVWLFLMALGIWAAALIWKAYGRWRTNAYRRSGIVMLNQIKEQLVDRDSETAVVQELSVLLKRVALAAFPRRQVASLSGESWLNFLERTCPDCIFMTGPGRLIGSASSSASDAQPLSIEECNHLMQLSHNWIKNHRRDSETKQNELIA